MLIRGAHRPVGAGLELAAVIVTDPQTLDDPKTSPSQATAARIARCTSPGITVAGGWGAQDRASAVIRSSPASFSGFATT